MNMDFLKFDETQIITFAIILGTIFIYIFLERIIPYNKQKFFREDWFDDFFLYNIFQSAILGFIIFKLIIFVDSSTGISRLNIISHWPVWLQVILFLVVHDFYIYWMHRAQHRNKYLWRLHEAHHSPKDIDWLAGVRSNPLEIFINQTIEFLPIFLLGAAPEVVFYKGALSSIWGMHIHGNININSGFLQYFINGPEMHRWHHDKKALNRNFATKLAIWDWIFGTAYLPKGEKAGKYGIAIPGYPRGYLKQTLFSMRAFPRSNKKKRD